MVSMTSRQTLSCLVQGISHLELILTAFPNSATLARLLDLSLIPWVTDISGQPKSCRFSQVLGDTQDGHPHQP